MAHIHPTAITKPIPVDRDWPSQYRKHHISIDGSHRVLCGRELGIMFDVDWVFRDMHWQHWTPETGFCTQCFKAFRRSLANGGCSRRSVAQLLDEYDTLALECDGLTRVHDYVLAQEAITYMIMYGEIAHRPTGTQFEPHYWIELMLEGKPHIVDFRAHMWLGDHDDIARGVFTLTETAVRYDGQIADWQPTPEELYTLLVTTGRIDTRQLMAKLGIEPDRYKG
jgi:hypothetical protein